MEGRRKHCIAFRAHEKEERALRLKACTQGRTLSDMLRDEKVRLVDILPVICKNDSFVIEYSSQRIEYKFPAAMPFDERLLEVDSITILIDEEKPKLMISVKE